MSIFARLAFLRKGTIVIIIANCITMNNPKDVIDPVTGKIATLTKLKTTCKATCRRRIPFVQLKNQVMKRLLEK